MKVSLQDFFYFFSSPNVAPWSSEGEGDLYVYPMKKFFDKKLAVNLGHSKLLALPSRVI